MDDSDTVITNEMQEDTLRRFWAAFSLKHGTIDDFWQDEMAGVGSIYGTLTGTFEAALGLTPDGETDLFFDLHPYRRGVLGRLPGPGQERQGH